MGVFHFEWKFGLSETIALLAFLASLFALKQTWEANSPRITVSPLPVRSYSLCNTALRQFQSRSVVVFRITNNGGRPTTLVGITQADGVLPVFASIGGVHNPKAWTSLTYLEKFGELPEGVATPTWILDPIFAESRPLILKENRATRSIPRDLDILLEPGKPKLLAFGLTGDLSGPNGRVDNIAVTLLGNLSNGESALMQSSVIPALVGRGRCPF